ncbi:hypothetical protein AB0M59_20310, partial [Amycolatopsis sp. NPDC051371]
MGRKFGKRGKAGQDPAELFGAPQPPRQSARPASSTPLADQLSQGYPGVDAGYVVLPRSLAEGMSLPWQHQMAALLAQFHAEHASLAWPIYRVVPSRYERLADLDEEQLAEAGYLVEMDADGDMVYRERSGRKVEDPENTSVLVSSLDPIPRPAARPTPPPPGAPRVPGQAPAPMNIGPAPVWRTVPQPSVPPVPPPAAQPAPGWSASGGSSTWNQESGAPPRRVADDREWSVAAESELPGPVKAARHAAPEAEAGPAGVAPVRGAHAAVESEAAPPESRPVASPEMATSGQVEHPAPSMDEPGETGQPALAETPADTPASDAAPAAEPGVPAADEEPAVADESVTHQPVPEVEELAEPSEPESAAVESVPEPVEAKSWTAIEPEAPSPEPAEPKPADTTQPEMAAELKPQETVQPETAEHEPRDVVQPEAGVSSSAEPELRDAVEPEAASSSPVEPELRDAVEPEAASSSPVEPELRDAVEPEAAS